MGKEWFSLDRVVSLSSVPPGGKIHVIGVCGVAMAQLAVTLSELGFAVSGSDKEFYEPMGSLLKSSAVHCKTGYSAENVPSDAALVVVGNAVAYENPEVQAVEHKKLPYTLFPKLLAEAVIEGRHSIVVSGTHGKTTTTGIVATALGSLGRSPSYFIGGVARDLPQSLVRGEDSISVVEGDEYDSAFFAKVPKFTFYKPTTLIVTSIEYDHADIYPDLEAINKEFTKRVLSMKEGLVIACADTENVATLVESWKGKTGAKIVTYGESPKVDLRLLSVSDKEGKQQIVASWYGGKKVSFTLQIPGRYNALNGIAAIAAMVSAGVPLSDALEGVSAFSGVRRRQEVRAEKGGITLVEDFAHHPTAVKETLEGIAARYPRRKIWAVFEPRSNTSRRKVFQEAYENAFKIAGEALLSEVQAKSIDAGLELIAVSDLAKGIAKKGTPCRAVKEVAGIKEILMNEVKPNDVIVVMSNGSFGGLIDQLVKWIG